MLFKKKKEIKSILIVLLILFFFSEKTVKKRKKKEANISRVSKKNSLWLIFMMMHFFNGWSMLGSLGLD